MRRRAIAPAFLLIAAGLSCDVQSQRPASTVATPGQPRPGVTSVSGLSAEMLANVEASYVPVYSHVYTADTAQALNLAATLFARNTDATTSVILTRVSYVGSDGKTLQEFLKSPLRIAPLASMDFFIKESDVTGGASPSFLVEYVREGPASEPIVESVMVGTAGTQGISFTCSGRRIAPRKP